MHVHLAIPSHLFQRDSFTLLGFFKNMSNITFNYIKSKFLDNKAFLVKMSDSFNPVNKYRTIYAFIDKVGKWLVFESF